MQSRRPAARRIKRCNGLSLDAAAIQLYNKLVARQAGSVGWSEAIFRLEWMGRASASIAHRKDGRSVGRPSSAEAAITLHKLHVRSIDRCWEGGRTHCLDDRWGQKDFSSLIRGGAPLVPPRQSCNFAKDSLYITPQSTIKRRSRKTDGCDSAMR